MCVCVYINVYMSISLPKNLYIYSVHFKKVLVTCISFSLLSFYAVGIYTSLGVCASTFLK